MTSLENQHTVTLIQTSFKDSSNKWAGMDSQLLGSFSRPLVRCTILCPRGVTFRILSILIRLMVVLRLFSSPLQHPSEQANLKRERLPKPSSTLCVISNVIASVRMQQRRQGTPIDNQPRNEGTKLSWREQVYFEHGNGMWAHWLIPYSVNAQLRDCNGMNQPESSNCTNVRVTYTLSGCAPKAQLQT